MAEQDADGRINVNRAADLTGSIIGILVGEEGNLSQVHQSILSAGSQFFDAALEKRWTEVQTREVSLPEEKPEVFHAYAQYLYSGAIACKGQETKDDSDVLAELHALGTRFMDHHFKDRVIDALMATWNEDRSKRNAGKEGKASLPLRTINCIYNATSDGSPGRRLLADVSVVHRCSDWDAFKDAADAEKLHHDFLLDLVKALMDKRVMREGEKNDFEDQTLRRPCIYHHHAPNQPCLGKRHGSS